MPAAKALVGGTEFVELRGGDGGIGYRKRVDCEFMSYTILSPQDWIMLRNLPAAANHPKIDQMVISNFQDFAQTLFTPADGKT